MYKEKKKKKIKARWAYATFDASLTSSNAFLSVHLQFVYQWGGQLLIMNQTTGKQK